MIPQNLQPRNSEGSALQKFIREFNPLDEEQATSSSNVSNRTQISSDTHLKEFRPLQPVVEPIYYASVYEHIASPQAPKAIKKTSYATNMEGIVPRKLTYEEKENQSDYLPLPNQGDYLPLCNQSDYLPMTNQELLNFFSDY